MPQKDIRPPRWEMHSSTEGRRVLEGGSLAVDCLLCPVRQGAFRQTVDTHEWVHQVCVLAEVPEHICCAVCLGFTWHQIVDVLSGCWSQTVWCT